MKWFFIFLSLIINVAQFISAQNGEFNIETSDQQKIVIEPELIELFSEYSQTLKDMLEEVKELQEEKIRQAQQAIKEGKQPEVIEAEVIPLTIHSDDFEIIKKIFKDYYDQHYKKQLNTEKLFEEIKNEISKLDIKRLITIANTANYLDIKLIYTAALEILAKKIYSQQIIKSLSNEDGLKKLTDIINQLAPNLQQIIVTGPLGIKNYKAEIWRNIKSAFYVFSEIPLHMPKLTIENIRSTFAWNANGTHLALRGNSKTVLWDAQNKNTIDIKGNYSLFAWSPDNTKIVLLSDSAISNLFIYDLERKKLLSMEKIPGSFSAAYWSPDGEFLALKKGNEAHVWNSKTDKVDIIKSPKGSFFEISWSPDSKNLALQSKEATMIWNSFTKESTKKEGSFPIIEWSFTGEYLALGSLTAFDIWNVKKDATYEFGEFNSSDSESGFISWSPVDNKLILYGNLQRLLINMDNLQIDQLYEEFYDVAWSKDKFKIALLNSQKILIINLKTMELVNEIMASYSSLSWSSDNTKLALGSHYKIDIWDSNTQRMLFAITGYSTLGSKFSLYEWSPKRNKLMVGGDLKTILVDVDNEQLDEIEGNLLPFRWSPDETNIALKGDEKIVIWELYPALYLRNNLSLLQTLFLVWLAENNSMIDQIPEHLKPIFESLPELIKEKIRLQEFPVIEKKRRESI